MNLIIVQQDETYSVYYISAGSSTYFGCWQPSSGARTAVITASGTGQPGLLPSALVVELERERMVVDPVNPLTPNDLYMSRTAPLTSKRCILYTGCAEIKKNNSGAKGLINTRNCNYSCTSSWWWVSTPETCRAAYRNIINWISRILLDSY